MEKKLRRLRSLLVNKRGNIYEHKDAVAFSNKMAFTGYDDPNYKWYRDLFYSDKQQAEFIRLLFIDLLITSKIK